MFLIHLVHCKECKYYLQWARSILRWIETIILLCVLIYQTAPIGRIRMEKEDFDLLFFNTF